jgi:hypothetical protein
MSILNDFTPEFNYDDAGTKEMWTELMSSKDRDWAEIYREFKPQLSQYIEFLRLNSLDHDDAETELKFLKTIFDWVEEFHLLWEIDAWIPSVRVKYTSIEEMFQADKEESEPDESPQDAWYADGENLDLTWGRSKCASVSISSLNLR